MWGWSLPRGAFVLAGFVALNLLLFVPLYLLDADENDFWPFFPLGHPRGAYDWGWPGIGRSTYEYAMQLFVRRFNKDIFRISADWVFIFSSLILAARLAGRWRPTAVPLAGLGYAVLLVFMAYSGFIQYLFDRPGTLLDDVLMLESAWIFVRDTWGLTELLYVVAGLAAVAGLGVLAARCLDTAWRWGAGLERRRAVAGWTVVNLYCVLSLSWFGVARDDPIIQLQAKHLHYNWQRSQDVLATVAALDGSVVEAAAHLAETTPVRRPDLFFFEVESYGAALWADDDYLFARRGLMRRLRNELEELRLPMFTRFASSPVHGGGSWMSTASALSGIRMESHSVYWAWKRMADRYPHLIAYLKRHGYYTLAVQPGATWAEDIYGYDDVIIRPDFSYDGWFYGFGHVPDQWALDHAFTKHWSRHPRPRLFHFFGVSTHFAWEAPPRITEDVAELEVAPTRVPGDAAGLRGARGDGSPGLEAGLLRHRRLRMGAPARGVPATHRIRIHRPDLRRPPAAVHRGRAGRQRRPPARRDRHPHAPGTAGGRRLRGRRDSLAAFRVEGVPDGGHLSVPAEPAVHGSGRLPALQPDRHRGAGPADLVGGGGWRPSGCPWQDAGHAPSTDGRRKTRAQCADALVMRRSYSEERYG